MVSGFYGELVLWCVGAMVKEIMVSGVIMNCYAMVSCALVTGALKHGTDTVARNQDIRVGN